MKQSEFKIPYSRLESLIDEWVLSERNRKILKRKLLDKVTFERLAEEMDLSVRQTEYILHDGKETIKEHI
jgi:hypothetical protein